MIGQSVNRIDGPLKVSGQAPYAYEQWEAGQPLYGFILGATVGRGHITGIDTARAERAPGVRMVMTYRNAPAQGKPNEDIPSMYRRAYPVLSSPEIHHYGEPVALVVATTFEEARAAANLIDVEYAVEEGHFDFAARQGQPYAPKLVNGFLETDTTVGDFQSAFDAGPVKMDQTYTTPYYFSQPMEPQSCMAAWDGDLTVYTSVQIVSAARSAIAETLRIAPERIHVRTPFVGGGFGSKLGIHAETILAVLAARELNQPVKVAQTRQQVFHLAGVRPTSSQRVRLAAERDGRLVAIAHEANMYTSPRSEYAEQIAVTTRALYAAPNRITRHRLTPLDLLRGEDVRAPGEATGLIAVESAMDELAHQLGIDPVELRIRNEPAVHPETGHPFSDRRLVECMREGARRFGWDRRPQKPASLRDGRWLIGYGMAAAIRMHFQTATKVRVQMGVDGVAVVQSDMTDIGGGTYTILAQVAAADLGLPMDRVRVEIGRSEFPESWGSAGSWGAANSTSALHAACDQLREKLLAAARNDKRSPLHKRDAEGARFADGRIRIGEASEDLSEIVARNFPGGAQEEGEIAGMEDEANYQKYSLNTYGALFAEVGVDVDTAEVRLRRMLGVFSAGRFLNPKTARSQLIGGMIFGVSYALFEQAVLDTRSGAFVNRDLAEYLVPVHADIPNLDAVLLQGFDDKANVLGAKGIGELGICGSAPAVANAVFHATGVRVRDFPITLDKILPGLPVTEG